MFFFLKKYIFALKYNILILNFFSMLKFTINKKIKESIIQYCKINDIEYVNSFMNNCLIQGFNIVKYGNSPIDNLKREKEGIKEINDVILDNIDKKKEEKSTITRKIRVIKKK